MEGANDSPQTFTVSEANALLPRVTPLIIQLQALQRSMTKVNRQLNDAMGKLAEGNGYPIAALQATIQELTAHQLHSMRPLTSKHD